MAKQICLQEIRDFWEPSIYDELRAKYGTIFREHWEKSNISPPSPTTPTILLVERRPHPNIEFVLHNAVYFCPGFSLTIVCSDENLDCVKEIVGRKPATIIPYFKGIGTRDQGRAEYNQAFMTLSFWELIEADYILSIQTDSYLLRPLPLTQFKQFDYIACPWDWMRRLVGGGGLTWRKKEAVLDILHNYPFKKADGEDVYFSNACEALEKKVPNDEERKNFFVESCLFDIENPIGVHQWWTYWAPLDEGSVKERIWKICMTIEL